MLSLAGVSVIPDTFPVQWQRERAFKRFSIFCDCGVFGSLLLTVLNA